MKNKIKKHPSWNKVDSSFRFYSWNSPAASTAHRDPTETEVNPFLQRQAAFEPCQSETDNRRQQIHVFFSLPVLEK